MILRQGLPGMEMALQMEMSLVMKISSNKEKLTLYFYIVMDRQELGLQVLKY